MLNMVMIENDFFKTKNLVNYISINNKNMKILYIANNIKEALTLTQYHYIDLILIDLETTNILEKDIINYIHLNTYLNFIIISNNVNLINQIKLISNKVEFISNPINFKTLESCIQKFIEQKNSKNKEEYINEKINNELIFLNFKLSYKGTKYIAEVVLELYKKNYEYCNNLSKYIYPIIAKKYNTTINNIKCNITQSVKSMYYDCQEQIIINYFSYKCLVKPTVKEVIFTILNKIILP